MKVFDLPLPNGFTYNVEVKESGEVKANVTFPMRYACTKKGVVFADKLAHLLLMKDTVEVSA